MDTRDVDSRDEAFQAFVTRRSASLLRTAFVLTGERAQAEDLLQTALLKTYRHWRRLDDQHDPAAFVRKVLVTTHLSWRRRRPASELVVETLPERLAPDEYAAVPEREQMWAALRRLPPRMRAVIVLRFYEDLTEAETARHMGCTAGTVKSQTSRGLARLRTDLTLGNDPALEQSPERGTP